MGTILFFLSSYEPRPPGTIRQRLFFPHITGCRLSAFIWIAAGLPDALEGIKLKEFDMGSKESILYWFLFHEVSAEIFLVIVGKDCDHNGILAQVILNLQGSQKVCP